MKTITFFRSTIWIVILLCASNSYSQSPVSSGLIAHYCFDGNANDAVGSRNCTVYGASLTTDRNGIANSAYSFDGTDDYIQAPNDVWFSGDFTVSAWLNVSTYKDFGKFFDFSNGAPGDNIMYSPTPTAFIGDAFIIRKNSCTSTPYEESAYSSPFPLNSWVYVTLVLRGTVGEVWRNGVNTTVHSSTILGPVCSSMRTKNYFGKSPWSHDEFFHGKMDDIRIYNRALNALEIDTLYKINQTCQQQTNILNNSSPIDFYLSQNTPNPSGSGTIIQYKLPQGTEQALIEIIDITGKKAATYPLYNSEGKVEVNAEGFHSGMYFYSLYVDGKVLGRKKMLVQKF